MTDAIAIEASVAEGRAEGYAVDSDAEQLVNWLRHRHGVTDPECVADLRTRFGRIAFLNNLNVDEASRGLGHGTRLLNDFIEAAGAVGAETVLLLADAFETQADGFDLVTWYRRHGFEVLRETGCGPVMALDE